ncbi:MAG: hypothetical protein H8Z69_02840 [Nanohaloarchaea archaeon]|nr:hypothetical protein [Candidatus Nanohaloarchaea archaeon]
MYEDRKFKWTKRYTDACLEVIKDEILEEGERITREKLENINKAPSRAIERRYNGMKNARYRFDKRPENIDLSGEDIRALFRERFEETEGFPDSTEFYSDPEMPNRSQVENQEKHGDEFTSFSELAESEYPVRFAQREDGSIYDNFYSKEYEPGKWRNKESTRESARQAAVTAVEELEIEAECGTPGPGFEPG